MKVRDYILEEIKQVFDTEIDQLQKVKNILNNDMVDVIKKIETCTGKVIICGMGKPGHIAKKIAATFSSVGIPSYSLHPAEAQHGDLGMLETNDVIVMISNSGETKEICDLLPNLKIIGIPIIAITKTALSTLGQYADFVIETGEIKEAGRLGLAPTSSTTVELVIGDAIAVVVSKRKGFQKEDFALFHPAGSLGKKLLTTVENLMVKNEKLPLIYCGEEFNKAISLMSESEYGAILVINSQKELKGIITDGDLKRFISKYKKIKDFLVDDVMTKKPIYIDAKELAVEALKLMEKRNPPIHCLAVVENEKVVGLISNHDVINSGIFL